MTSKWKLRSDLPEPEGLKSVRRAPADGSADDDATNAAGQDAPATRSQSRCLTQITDLIKAVFGSEHELLLERKGEGGASPLLTPAAAIAPLAQISMAADADATASPALAALAGGRMIAIAQLSADPRWPTHTVQGLAIGIQSCWAVPVEVIDGEAPVVLVLYFRAPRELSAADRRQFDAILPLLRDALSHARASDAAPRGLDFHHLADTIPGCVYQRVVYPDGRIKYLYINDYSREIFGLSPDEIIADPEALFDHYTPEYRKIFRRKLVEASKAMKIWDVEASVITRDGRKKFTHAIAKPTPYGDDGAVLWTGVILDATRIKEVENNAAAAEERTRNAIVESLSQGFLLYNAEDQLVIRNSHFLKLYPFLATIASPSISYSDLVRAELSRAGALDISKGPLGEAFAERIAQHHAKNSVHEYQLDNDRWIQVNEHRTEDGGTAVIYTDVTELKRRERRIQHLAHHDALTGLANRILFRQRVEEALKKTQRLGSMSAIFCLDLDHFKHINDTMGHPAGDALLKTVAERLQSCLRDTDTASRLGGDEFAMVVTDLPSGEYATNLAWRVLGLLSQPIEINGQMVHTSSSIGIALSDAHTTNADSFLKNADLALYRAKSDGRGTFRFFETAMDAAAQERRALEVDLRKAIAFGQLELHYQPLVDIETNAIIAMEALVRWRHPERGLIPPGDFIGIAEETGVIMQLGDWVLARACKDAINWPSRIRVAVNLSPAQFKSRDVAEKIIRIVTQSTLMPERLELEVTESLLFRNTEANLTALHKLKEFGIQIAMDDFGTGYSSLGNLRSFPFDKIKIDRSFVAEMARNPDSQAIIQAVLNLGRSLGMKTTAEGVESVDQVAYLRAQGCTEVQGYYYSAPVPGHAVEELLRHEGSLADYRRTA